MAFGFRIGEASNPGPEVRPQIGCINPTGLLGRGQILAQLPRQSHSTVWAVSETHLTQQGKSKLSKELANHKTGYTMQMGASVPPKSCTISAVGGRHRGVGFLTNATSSPPMSPTWSQEQWNQQRIHAASFLMANRWIQGGVVYGIAAQPDTLATKEKTEQQISLLIERLVYNSEGLRFIAGDFNQPMDGLQSFDFLRQKGWVNVQQWALEKFGQPVQATCKGVTTKDHLFVSPELAMYLESVHVEDSWFPDHAVLWASFSSIGSPPNVPIWKIPRAFENVDLTDTNPRQTKNEDIDLTKAYQTIAMEFETRVEEKLVREGKPTLQPAQKGRASITEVTLVQEYSAPPRVGRSGDIQPTFHGLDLQHARMLRQSRRLVNYVRLADAKELDSTRAIHKDKLWQSIKNAQGFRPNFREHWKQMQGEGLKEIPETPPTRETASIIARCMEKELRNFEKMLTSSRTQQAKQRRLGDPNLVFKDLRQDKPQPLQALVDRCEAVVVEVDHDNFAIVVHPEQQWQTELPVWVGGNKTQIIHAEPDKLWLESITGLQPNQKVLQEETIGNILDLFSRFGKEWSARWDRHLSTDDSFWDPILDFAHSVFEQKPAMEYSPITLEQWRAELRKKKRHAAVGPDGMTKQDLLMLPTDLTLRLLDILAKVEQKTPWPIQMVTGFVVALEKTPGAVKVGQFRPITIFSLAYRVWGSIRAKQILLHLSSFAPMTCTGNLPNRFAAQVWLGIQSEIELAQHSNKKLSGVVIDLVKAFNHSPRVPILTMMKLFGIPQPILHAWSSALTGMQRRFKLRNCVGPSVKSSAGFAEGDALSVTAMLMTNIICHKWMSIKHPAVHSWSYVDNIECTTTDADEAEASLTSLQNFTDTMDVLIDKDKIYFWSINPTDRRQLRQNALTVKHSARDLGGHMQYTNQVTNYTVLDRCKAIVPVWNRLSRSLASYSQKVRAVKTKAWPNCLHGSTSTHIGEENFEALRTGCMQGLKVSHAGTSPLARMSLIEDPSLDPQFFTIFKTFSDFRSMIDSNVAACVMQSLQYDPRLRPPPGPCSVLLTRARQVGWEWKSETTFTDQTRRDIDVMWCPPQELLVRLKQAWQDRIKAILALRKTMTGMQWVSPAITKSEMSSLQPDEAAILRVSLNGTFFTKDHEHKQGRADTNECPFCGAEDSQLHRHWHCPEFQAQRSHLTQEQVELIQTLDPCVAVHGWIPEPPSVRQLQECLMDLPPLPNTFQYPAQLPTTLHCFTDGGCLTPTNPLLRVATWGFVVANQDFLTFTPIANGVVRGIIQTVVRGELCAAIQACRFALLVQKPIVLWVDNDLVHKRVIRYHRHPRTFKPNQKDVDLWMQLHDFIRQLGSLFVTSIKVVSHQSHSGAVDE